MIKMDGLNSMNNHLLNGLSNNKYITIARYGPTMTDREHFEFKGEGIVTHWTPMPELPKD